MQTPLATNTLPFGCAQGELTLPTATLRNQPRHHHHELLIHWLLRPAKEIPFTWNDQATSWGGSPQPYLPTEPNSSLNDIHPWMPDQRFHLTSFTADALVHLPTE
jgi:hypothetical protein